MTSRNKIFYFNGGTLPSTGMWLGEVFAISDYLVYDVMLGRKFHVETVCRRTRKDSPQIEKKTFENISSDFRPSDIVDTDLAECPYHYCTYYPVENILSRCTCKHR